MKRLKRLQQDHVNQIVSLSAVDDGWGDILWCAPLNGSSPDCGLTVSDPPLDDLVGVESHPHFVEFYETEAFLVDYVLDFLAVGVATRRAVIVFATETHRSMFDHALRAAGIDISEARRAGRFVVLDASKQLARFMVDGMPDPARFRAAIGQLVFQAVHTGRDVRIYGEMVAVLWDEGNVAAAIALEDLWNDLATSYRFSLFCSYPVHAFDTKASTPGYRTICGQHSKTILQDQGT